MRLILLVLSITCFALPSFAGHRVDNTLYAEVLSSYVNDGLVNYVALKDDRGNLDAYLEVMGRVDPEKLERDDQLAFYINLYNAATLRLIIDHYPVETIKDIGPFYSTPWKLKVVTLNGGLVTLDHIEHDLIRPIFNEPRIHFALNCSAKSCPPLASEPYEGRKLNAQLEAAAIGYINDGVNNFFDGDVLFVSKIFDWFSDDFPDNLVVWIFSFARGKLKDNFKLFQHKREKPKIRYSSYNWSLNELPTK